MTIRMLHLFKLRQFVKKLFSKTGYLFFIVLVKLFQIMPLSLIYRISDFIFVLMFYVFSYRKSVIDKNLNRCFPEKSFKEKKQLRKKFYKGLSDLLVETIKGFTLGEKELLKRYTSKGHELIAPFFDQGKDVFIISAHFGNWEWGNATIAKALKHQTAIFYKPMSNDYLEKYTKERRGRFGGDMLSIYHSMRYLVSKKPKPVAYFLVADQYPTTKEKQKMVDFFGAKTGFLHGPEDFSRQMGTPVFYMEMRRLKRGYYCMEYFLLTENAKELPANELTQLYARHLEDSIRKQPEDWMWSHKRWKKKLYAFD